MQINKPMQILGTILLILLGLLALLYLIQHKLIFFPQKLSRDHTFTFSQPFEERFFNTAEGIRINALHFKTKAPRGLIYYFHGNAGSLEGWGQVAEDLLPFGYDVLIIDYRGYGKSNGRQTEKGMLSDAQTIYEELLKEYEADRIILYGRSIGSGMATWLAAKNDPGMLILESPFYNLPDVAKQYFPWFPSALIRFRFRNDQHVREVKCPIVIFHGTRDEVINVKASHRLKELVKPGDRVFFIEGGHHNDLILFEEFREKLGVVLEEGLEDK